MPTAKSLPITLAKKTDKCFAMPDTAKNFKLEDVLIAVQ